MKNEQLFEGFWDTLITKAKQGVYAVGGALGSGHAQGKLSASLLSDSMFQQWKQWAASTGSSLNKDDFTQFMKKMGFSDNFTTKEVAELNKFLAPTAGPADGAQDSTTAQPETQATANQNSTTPASTNDAEQDNGPKTADDHLAAAAQKARDAREGNKKPEPDENQKAVQKQMDARNKFQAKKQQRQQAKESLNEDVVSDSELRKFFDTLAKRALKTGEAKSAAQQSISINQAGGGETNNQQQPQRGNDQAPAQNQTTAQTQAAPVQRQQKTAPAQKNSPSNNRANRRPLPGQPKPGAQPQAKPTTDQKQTTQPAQPAAQPTPAPASAKQYTPKEKEMLDRYGDELPNQIGSADKDVTALARRIMRDAVAEYKKATGGQPKQAEQPAEAPQQQQAQPAQQPAAPQTPPPPPRPEPPPPQPVAAQPKAA